MGTFKPMLAAKIEATSLGGMTFPVMVSPKIDGVRAVVRDGVVLSRSLKPIPNAEVQRLFGHRAFDGFDGELIVGHPWDPDVFRRTTSCVMSDAQISGVISFCVFDDFTTPQMPFVERITRVKTRIHLSPLTSASLFAVKHHSAATVERVLDHEEDFLEQGYEGAMIRSVLGPYKFGRATLNEGSLLKLKRFLDSEARILRVEELHRNTNERKLNELGKMQRTGHKSGKVPAGTLGALHVQDEKTGAQFSVGSGFDDFERARLWRMRKDLPGRIIKYRYFPSGSKERPRFPTFLGFRDARDMS